MFDNDKNTFTQENLVTVTYKAVRDAMKGEPFKMKLSSSDYKVFAKAVNQGIDAHLEACHVPTRGDKVDGNKVVVSVESMPVLLRRLYEDDNEGGMSLASTIMQSLGFNDAGKYVGRDD